MKLFLQFLQHPKILISVWARLAEVFIEFPQQNPCCYGGGGGGGDDKKGVNFKTWVWYDFKIKP